MCLWMFKESIEKERKEKKKEKFDEWDKHVS